MTNFLSLIFYFTSFTVTYFLFLISSKNEKQSFRLLALGLALAIPVILASARTGVGTDYYNYMRTFNRAGEVSILEHINNYYFFEFGDFLIQKIANVFQSFSLFLGIYAAITIAFVYLAMKEHGNKISIGLGMYLYLFIFLPSSLNLIRQFAAISIIVFSFKYIFEKNIVKFSSLVIFASLFHTTAVFIFPVYFLWDKSKSGLIKRWKVGLAVLVCFLVVYNFQFILSLIEESDLFGRFSVYALENDRGQNRDQYLRIMLFSLVFILRKHLIKYDQRNQLYILLFLFALIIGTTGNYSPWVKRIALNFEIAQIFLLPSIVQIFRLKSNRKIVELSILAYGLVFFILVFYILGHSNVIPYNFGISLLERGQTLL